jgi:hypothetical protein
LQSKPVTVAEAIKRLEVMDMANREEKERLISELRKKSRFDYLKKREVDKLDELEGAIQDDEVLFAGERYGS